MVVAPPIPMRRTPIALLFLAACATDPGAEAPDGGVVTSADASPSDAGVACPLAPTVLGSRHTAGGRVVLDEVAEDALLEIPAGWREAIHGARRVLRVANGAGGEVELQLSRPCGASETVRLQIQPLELTALPAWVPEASGPSEREHPALWIDAEDPDRLWLFGGLTFRPRQFTVASDLWSHDLSSGVWTRHDEQSGAPERAAGRTAPVPGARAILHLGGSDQQNAISRRLERLDYDALTWHEVEVPNPPSGNILSAFVYDAPRDRFLSACGFGEAAVHCLVHAFTLDPPAASRLTLHLDEGLSGRYGFLYAFDAETERLVIVSGGQSSRSGAVNPAQDSWALELAEDPPRWVELGAGGEHPPGRRNGCGALDPEGHRLFLWGGTADAATTLPGLWALDLDRGHEGWSRIELPSTPPERSSCVAVYDPARRRVLFGFGNTAQARYADLVALEL